METNAEAYVRTLVGKTIKTLAGQPNTIAALEGDQVLVVTKKRPEGAKVPLDSVQAGIDQLLRDGSLAIDVSNVGYRSAFVGAVLASMPGVVASLRPARVSLERPLRPLMERALLETPRPRTEPYSGSHPLAVLFTRQLEAAVTGILGIAPPYLVTGSVGRGRWAETPWVAVFDPLVTVSAQQGIYVVYLFRRDGSGLYLSLNQGTTEVQKEVKGRYREVLEHQATLYAGLIPPAELTGLETGKLDLGRGGADLTQGYESGNIAARFYPASQLPSEAELASDLHRMLRLYGLLVASLDRMKAGEEEESGAGHPKDQKEARRLAWHLRAEGRNSAAARAAKKHHGHVCQVCAFDFEKAYGPLGHQYIEAHHLTPFSELDERPKKIDPATDYAVVCSNCHRMLHRRLPPLTPAELKSHLQ